MFERFTKRARAALVHAQAEARDLGHNFLGTEHILLGLLADGESVAARLLAAEGLTLGGVRNDVERIVGRGGGGAAPMGDAEALAAIGIDLDSITAAVEGAFGEGALDRAAAKRGRRRRWSGPPFTPRAKKLLELSLREALSLDHAYLGTEHLLLGLVRLKEGAAYEIVAASVADPGSLRQKVVEEVNRLRRGA